VCQKVLGESKGHMQFLSPMRDEEVFLSAKEIMIGFSKLGLRCGMMEEDAMKQRN
jgi:hypothetical protein